MDGGANLNFYGSMSNDQGHLIIGGVDAVELAETYGTPLFVYDVSLIRERARGFLGTFKKLGVNAQVAYASKAFSSVAVYQLAAQEGLSLDVVSGGELFTALKAGFPAEKIHFHGNNKSPAEIEMAFDANIGCIVIDNFYEIGLVKSIAESRSQEMDVLLRVTPGIEAHTHDYITTGQEDSKFGFDLKNGQADEAIQQLTEHRYIRVLGLHCHIGSQIFETTAFKFAAEALIQKMIEWKDTYAHTSTVLNLGGGFGIRYTDEDQPLNPSVYVEEMVGIVRKLSEESGYPLPEIWIEPGRSLVGDAGTTLYTVGSNKTVPSIRQYLAVDGGMSDNIRPALYGAKYDAVIANKVDEPRSINYTIAGKCCESGDKLIDNVSLPEASAGDILAVFCTGAYGYSMASNYNRLPRPAVVFVEDSKHQLVIRRETYEDLLINDLPFTMTERSDRIEKA